MHTPNAIGRGPDGLSSHENMSGGKAPKAATHARPIGCLAIVRKTEIELRRAGSAAIAERGWRGVNLGLARHSPGYMIWVPELDSPTKSRVRAVPARRGDP